MLGLAAAISTQPHGDAESTGIPVSTVAAIALVVLVVLLIATKLALRRY